MSLSRGERRLLIALLLAYAALVAIEFPYSTDEPMRREDELAQFYATTYEPEGKTAKEYAEIAARARVGMDVRGRIRRFVDAFQLHHARVLDVGSGDGYLQDMVSDYTGIDISKSAVRHYHKPFVHGTATAMPFEDGSFDAVCSVFVLEHIPNPEAALREMRRVLKPGGLLYLLPAWHCAPWYAEGYAVRPYSDFRLSGKIVKATVPARDSLAYWLVTVIPGRLMRAPALLFGPTTFHYRRLSPNYDTYWQADSDAVAGLDFSETAMWFQSRGDECLNCGGWRKFVQLGRELIIRVQADKQSGLSESRDVHAVRHAK